MLQPFVTLNGNAEEAMGFYESVFDCENKFVMPWGDRGMPAPEKMKGKVLYGHLTIDGTHVMFCDMDCEARKPEDFAATSFVSLAMNFDSEDKLREAYGKLADGGKILMEIGPQFFAKLYAWVQDRFGVTWQLTHTVNEESN